MQKYLTWTVCAVLFVSSYATVGVVAQSSSAQIQRALQALGLSKQFLVVFTNVTAASEAYTLYSLGTTVF